MPVSHLESAFLAALAAYAPGLTAPVPEYRFAPPRRWRFDFCWVEARVAIEIEGIYGTKSRHLTTLGYHADCEKYRAATLAGYAVLRYTSKDLASEAGRRAVVQEVAAFVQGRM